MVTLTAHPGKVLRRAGWVRAAVAREGSRWLTTRSGSRVKGSFKEPLSIVKGSPLDDRQCGGGGAVGAGRLLASPT
jgi:hypothetical protein